MGLYYFGGEGARYIQAEPTRVGFECYYFKLKLGWDLFHTSMYSTPSGPASRYSAVQICEPDWLHSSTHTAKKSPYGALLFGGEGGI